MKELVLGTVLLIFNIELEDTTMERILSDWSKAIKHKMIDRDMDIKDVAKEFHWTRQYTSSLINGVVYYREPVIKLSYYFNVEVPQENATLCTKRKK